MCLLGYAARPTFSWTQPWKRARQSTPRFFSKKPLQAGDYLRRIARPGDVILMKGSRGTHVEQALEKLLAPPN